MSERTNVGYVITESIHIYGREFVLGQDPNKSSPYVTWECKDGKDYYFGHYFSSLENAQRDLIERAYNEMKFIDHMKNRDDRSER